VVAALAAVTLPDGRTESAAIAEALALRAGQRVADVGAGDGEFSVELAERVGAAGHVYATEVDDAKIDKIRSRAAAAGVPNVTALRGEQQETGLPAGCCDGILLRLVYHHFTDPAAMRRSLWNALRSGGRIAVIDVPPQKSWRRIEGVPDRGGHGIEVDELVGDMTASGFEVVERHDQWPSEDEAYCVVFRRPGVADAAERRRAWSSTATSSGRGFQKSRRTRPSEVSETVAGIEHAVR
jgi:precorrin-6B methylase 2